MDSPIEMFRGEDLGLVSGLTSQPAERRSGQEGAFVSGLWLSLSRVCCLLVSENEKLLSERLQREKFPWHEILIVKPFS